MTDVSHSLTCSNCGSAVPAGAHFCPACAAPQFEIVQEAENRSLSPPAPSDVSQPDADTTPPLFEWGRRVALAAVVVLSTIVVGFSILVLLGKFVAD